MASCVFVKFMSQKEPRRIEFDGTGISVFELKRDIIVKNGLDRSGTDFDLAIYDQDGKEEYDDDTSVIARSTTVLARRLPAMKPGAGRAARYISGKMPAQAKNHSRREQATKTATAKSQSDALAKMASAQTEEEKMMAMFAAQGEQWKSAQEEMATQTPVYRPGQQKKPANVPDHEPPNGYVCHRCGEKGHWIQMCPTNDNPEYNDRPRFKRTTGIPKSFLKTVDKATVLAQGGDEDGSKPASYMVNADGEFVVPMKDTKTWDQFQAKAKGSEGAKKAAAQDEQELRERNLECGLDHRMFIDPMKTPCCGKTYCNDCITDALIEGDLVCPACQTEGVLIDDLKLDDEAVKRINDYMKEKEVAKKERSETPEDAKSPASEDIKEDIKESIESADIKTEDKSKSPTPSASVKSPSASADAAVKSEAVKSEVSPTPTLNGGQQPANSKKRPADTEAENPIAKAPKGPKAMQRAQEQQQQQQMNMMPDFMGMGAMGMNGMNGMGGFNPMGMGMGMGMPMGMNPMMNMNMPGMMNGFNPMAMPMGMGMNPMMNPMMMNNGMGNGMGNGMNNGMNNGGGFHNGGGNMNRAFNNGPRGGGFNRGGFNRGPQQMNGNHHNNFQRGPPTGPRQQQQQQGGNFNPPQQQQQAMSNNAAPNANNTNMNANGGGAAVTNAGTGVAGAGPGAGAEDGAYIRQPVNPQRHQNRQRRVRPSDYREL